MCGLLSPGRIERDDWRADQHRLAVAYGCITHARDVGYDRDVRVAQRPGCPQGGQMR